MKLFRQKKNGEVQAEICPVRHIAFIMDGNGRWAKKRGMPREFGHREGAKAFQRVVEYCGEIGIQYVTVYAFSTENWKRPENEVQAIMKLFNEYMGRAFRTFAEKGIRIRFIGNRSCFGTQLLSEMEKLEKDSACNTKVLNVAFNYGGREELINAVKGISNDVKEGKYDEDDITEEVINSHLYTANQPDVDLLIRTSGEQRLSNFMLWQVSYAEMVFVRKLWPDFKPADLRECIRVFQGRGRRFGGI
jgi:undecaprenyl diphosphate synthase